MIRKPSHSHSQLQHIPVIRTPSSQVSDVEALEHARRCVSEVNNGMGHPLNSRAMSELDRLIDHAKRTKQ